MAAQADRGFPSDASVDVLERGNIYFAYRPRDDGRARGVSDVERVYMILGPHGSSGPYRLSVIGGKRLPAIAGEARKVWARVDRVSTNADEVEDELDPRRTLTKAGEGRVPAARPAGEGVYAIVRHRGHTHLAYVLELPEQMGDVQRALNIMKEASYVVSVKHPKAPIAPDAGIDPPHEPELPRSLMLEFRGRSFAPLDPPKFIDHEGTVIVLVGATPDVSAELGVQLDAERETEATADIFSDLRMEQSLHPATPLFTGRWE